ncbi:hypothetical protein ACFOWA_14525 [Pedobacter lithocola]|uniref:Uncharacterized protein n=1 Tax=Pedobacter lithocola TaxID=1908239 RepID=A0ABV8PE30_9SPHI
MKLQHYKDFENESTIRSSQSTWRVGSYTVNFITTKEHAHISNQSSKSIVIQFLGKKPIVVGGKFSILTFGIKIIKYRERLKLGWIKRKQVLEKV